MFTGLVQALGTFVSSSPRPPGARLQIRVGELAAQCRLGDSVAVNGCCLTVVDLGPDALSFDISPETLRRTNLGELGLGSHVNLERSLRAGDPLGGHFVTGHVDGVGTVVERHEEGEWVTMWFSFPPELGRQIAPKGSIAVDGVSLTLVDVAADRFSAALIPHTLAVTTLGQRRPGDRVNLETDLLAKYVAKLIG